MSHDPESTLRPLRAVAVDVEALRAGQVRAGAVVRVARAAETALRRMLRDDPTAPVELRLRALSADDLPHDELLAELRRRDRLPMELAAAIHDLSATAARLASEGGDAAPRDGEAAIAVADGLERHVRAHPFDATLEDPVLTGDETLFQPPMDDEERVHAVPHFSRIRPVWPWVAGALGLVGLVLLLSLLFRGGDSNALERGAAAYRAREMAKAEQLFLEAKADEPEAPLPRYYLALLYRTSGRRAEAARELREGLSHAPDDPRLNTELGYLLMETGRAEEAVDRLRRAVVLDSTSARAWSGLVLALRGSGRAAQAERVLSRAPANVRALIRSGDTASVR